jgi:hypothetical protein
MWLHDTRGSTWLVGRGWHVVARGWHVAGFRLASLR